MEHKIFVTGDIHRLIDIRKLTDFFDEHDDLTKDDHLIICGDVGVCWNRSRKDQEVREILSGLPVTVLWIDGNHENFDLIDEYDIEMWNSGKVHFIEEDIIHLTRGQVFNIYGVKIFTFGGAYSQDKLYRTENVSWWQQEVPNEEEMSEGRYNLERNNNSVDYIITHTAPYEVLAELGMDIADDEYEFVSYLDSLRCSIDFKEWYFGHLHLDKDVENYHALYDRILLIGGDNQ